MSLTDTKIRNARPGDKPIKIRDGRGLYLLVHPNGGKWWRFDYRFGGKRKTLSMGTYPDVSLKKARERLQTARGQVADGIDPSEHRKAQKRARQEATEHSFEVIAREWFGRQELGWAPGHASKVIRRLECDVFPYVGSKPIKEVDARTVLEVLRRVEKRGAVETAHRVRQIVGQVFRYAVATARAEGDPTYALRGALRPVKREHHPSVTEPKAIGGLLRALEGYDGQPVTKCALRLAPLVFVRPGELRHAEWSEIDLEAAEWRIPAEKMKAKAAHMVPLSRQAVEVLRELQPLTGPGRYVFPSVRTAARPMSNNTVNSALRRMGYAKDEMTGHGFRSMASTRLHEMGWPSEVIERQLAHAERNAVKAAYNYAEHLPERREMMQAWADYLDQLRDGAEVLEFRRVR